MFDHEYYGALEVKGITDCMKVVPNLKTGEGHGHYRGPDIIESNHGKKLRKQKKMAKASKRRNRKWNSL